MVSDTRPAQVRSIEWSPRRSFVFLLKVVGVLISLHVMTGLTAMLVDSPWALGLYQIFNMGAEQNLPTHFAASLWLGAAALCWSLSRLSPPGLVEGRYWLALALVCLFISVDEIAMLHERLSGPVRELIGGRGALHYAWVVPYAVLTLTVIIAFSRFVWRLPTMVRLLIFVSGGVYVFGALGLEMAEGYLVHAGDSGRQGILYRAIYTIEESCELVGVSLFLYALLIQLKATLDRLPSIDTPIHQDQEI